MLNVGIVIGSTRPGRKAADVAQWVERLAETRDDARFEVVDIADFDLPLLDEAIPPSMGRYQHDHTKQWAEKVAQFDAFVFVTPEYNHSVSGALKNALDFVYAEWNDKAAAIVSYGSAGGVRAAEHLRLILAELQVATVRQQVTLSLFTDFENFQAFTPAERHEGDLAVQLDQLVRWGTALRATRRELAAA